MEIASKSQLAIILSGLKGFEEPRPWLEQYPTDAEIAAEVLWFAFYRREIEGKIIADLGCGTGVLGIGALLIGAKKVFFVDIDRKAIDAAKENVESAEKETGLKLKKRAFFVEKDVSEFDEKADVVVQNPPFGVQKEHADRAFLDAAFKSADVVYSFHKAESKRFVLRFSDEKGFKANGYWEFDFPIKMTMGFHAKRIHRFKVGCFRLERKT